MLSQNLQQQLSVPLLFIIEFYRVFLASLPLIFVPQLCDDKFCTIQQNFHSLSLLSRFLHFATTMGFLGAYGTELYREYWCIKKLDVDDSLPENRIISPSIAIDLKCINKIYVSSWFVVSGLYFVNSAYSSYILRRTLSSSNDALIAFMSYILNVCSKFYSTHSTIMSVLSDSNTISESAYLKKSVVFNVKETKEFTQI